MKFIRFCLMFLLGFSFVWGTDADAGFLNILIQMKLSVVSDRIKIRVEATNTGNESAHHLQTRLHVFDTVIESEILDQLAAGDTRAFQFEVSAPPDKTGRLPFVGEVLFHDANGYSFSALSGAAFLLNGKAFSNVIGQASDLTVQLETPLDVLITNLAPEPRNITATLYLPKGLTTPVQRRIVRLDPYGQGTARFPIRNAFGIEGAVLPIFCTVEYKEAGTHQVTVVQSTVRISEHPNWFLKTRWYWFAGMVPILLGWGGLWLFGKRFWRIFRR